MMIHDRHMMHDRWEIPEVELAPLDERKRDKYYHARARPRHKPALRPELRKKKRKQAKESRRRNRK